MFNFFKTKPLLVEKEKEIESEYSEISNYCNEYIATKDLKKFKHRIELLITRVRWAYDELKESIKYSERVKDHRKLKSLQSKIEEEYLTLQRNCPLSPDLPRLQGKLEVLRQIINEGWN